MGSVAWGDAFGSAWGSSWGLPASPSSPSGTVYGGTAGRVSDRDRAKIKAWLYRVEKPSHIARRKKLVPPSIEIPMTEIALVDFNDDEAEILLLS